MHKRSASQDSRHLSNVQLLRRVFALMWQPPYVCTCVVVLLFVEVGLTMASPMIVRHLIDFINTQVHNNTFGDIAITLRYVVHNSLLMQLLAITLVTALSMFASTVVLGYFIQALIIDLRERTIVHSLNQSMRYFHTQSIGTVVTHMTNDLDAATTFLQTLVKQIFASILSLVAINVALFIVNWRLTAAMFIGLPLIVVFIKLYRRNILKASQDLRAQRSELNTYTAEHLQGATDITIYNKRNASIESCNAITDVYYTKRIKLGTYMMFVRPFMNLFLAILIFIIIIFSAYFIRQGLVTVGIVIAFIQLANNFFSPIITLAQNATQIQESMAGVERILLFLDEQHALPQNNINEDNAARIASAEAYTLVFDTVSFRYTEHAPLVLHDISFSLSRGKRIALVGHSGSGKSTIARLCVRFWDPSSGSITLNGCALDSIPRVLLRSKVRLLQQESFIFEGTVRENLTMGKDISHKELDHVVQKSGLSEFVEQLPQGLDSVIQSSMLSTGQRRLMSICRVFLEAPPIVVLDEFSAVLDNATEHMIQTLLEELQRTRATLIIAHRLNTITTCDEILYVEEGRIIERGTHAHLVQKKKAYAHLIDTMHTL